MSDLQKKFLDLVKGTRIATGTDNIAELVSRYSVENGRQYQIVCPKCRHGSWIPLPDNKFKCWNCDGEQT